MAHARITARSLSYTYGGFRRENVLEDVSFSIHENEIVTIIGPNGGGKTTLLRLMVGLLPAEKGSLLVEGKVGYVPQHAGFDRHFPMSVFDVVLSGLVRPLRVLFQERPLSG